MKDKKRFLGIMGALGANLIFGFSFIASKIALSVAHPLIILSTRFTVAFLVLNVLLLCGIIKVDFKGKNLKRLFLMSLAQPLFYFILELYGIKMVSSALSGIIISLVPVGVLIYSAIFSGEKPSIRQYICTVVSVGAVVLISILSDDGQKNHLLGVLLLVGAVISAVAFNLLSRDQSKNFSPFERTYFMFLVGTIGFNAVAVSALNVNYISEIAVAFASCKFWLAIGYLAVLSSVAAFMMYNYSTTHISAVQSSSFSNIITVVSIFAGIVILKERFDIFQILLCVPIVLGVWGVNKK